MKMKPSQRNACKAKAKEAAREIARLERSLANFTAGTLPHRHLSEQIEAAKTKHRNATSSLARTTQPNGAVDGQAGTGKS